MNWRFEKTYARLPDVFYSPATPAPVREPRLVIFNHLLATELGLDFQSMTPDSLASLFSGQTVPPGSQPIAQAYAGHQYGGFTMLGDGRAILLGEHRTPTQQLVDIQLKGAGRTPYSRGGDGLAVLGPMLREYIISEAMAHLGIPTTRSLAVVATGESVLRETPRPGAILTRVAASHIRVGTFEYISARRDFPNLKLLADTAIARHYPEIPPGDGRYAAFLRAVCKRQAQLIARWQLVGFIHGVMNTDNMAISGETIDYGPCAFMNEYDPDTVYSSIDRQGRYAYGNQPAIAHWNLARFAESLLPLFDLEQEKAVAIALEILGEFPSIFDHNWLMGMRQKLGLAIDESGDEAMIRTLLDLMYKNKADFTNTFRDLSLESLPNSELYQLPEFQTWHQQWQSRRERESRTKREIQESMQQVNPAVIPRNRRVEETLRAAEVDGDFQPLHQLLEVIASPFVIRPEWSHFYDASPDDRRYRTFCGT